MIGRIPAAVRECDVPAVLARILAVHERKIRELLDRYGWPRSFALSGRRWVAEAEIRDWLVMAASRALVSPLLSDSDTSGSDGQSNGL